MFFASSGGSGSIDTRDGPVDPITMAATDPGGLQWGKTRRSAAQYAFAPVGQPGGQPPLPNRLRRRLFADTGQSFSERARAKRWAELLRRFPGLPDMRVLDLGGTTWFWTLSPVKPKSLVIVNLDEGCLRDDLPPWISTVRADACNLPPEVLDMSFDLVFSNSLVEHVGGPSRREVLAGTIARLSDHYWVQTPARSFPLEPHWMFPGFQFLPVATRAAISRRWPLSPPNLRRRSRREAIDDVLEVELLNTTEMKRLFPDAELWPERFLGLKKSIVAIH
jgi:hypothetical protein